MGSVVGSRYDSRIVAKYRTCSRPSTPVFCLIGVSLLPASKPVTDRLPSGCGREARFPAQSPPKEWAVSTTMESTVC